MVGERPANSAINPSRSPSPDTVQPVTYCFRPKNPSPRRSGCHFRREVILGADQVACWMVPHTRVTVCPAVMLTLSGMISVPLVPTVRAVILLTSPLVVILASAAVWTLSPDRLPTAATRDPGQQSAAQAGLQGLREARPISKYPLVGRGWVQVFERIGSAVS